MLQQVMTNPGEIIFREISFWRGKEKSSVGKDYEYWCLWIRYSCFKKNLIMENIRLQNIR